ncbi:MAG: STAS/SEC14 domain-containing protein [Oceanicoccus sp.]
MINIEIDDKNGIAILCPDGKLSEEDFKSAANIIDPYIEERGKLNGLIISAEFFPGWDSFAGLVSHLSFVRNHHKKIECISLVTDSPLGSLAESLANHFVAAKIRTFGYTELDLARSWIMDDHET